ncbi:hypothetical protein PITCH_A1050013 [uncultured Desulfobacterium sp.]|uniref:Uncharacterized protein n=1 Tax=uncultured Desulfobacterium sp. TaxID=201089 RepID=A0A445MQS8_9BACT|nr:hypothetical protein PITCH_A1050013 [uncultured Desulfobacterium sp.]
MDANDVIVECIYVLEEYYKIPRSEIVGKLSAILNFSGIVNSNKSQLIKAPLNSSSTNIDIIDCILAAHSSPPKTVASVGKDMNKIKTICDNLQAM